MLLEKFDIQLTDSGLQIYPKAFTQIAPVQDIFRLRVATNLATPIPVNDPPTFPLDPLTPTEQCLAVFLTQFYIQATYESPDPKLLFDRVELKLPPKEQVLAFQTGDPLVRQAFVAVYSPTHDKYHTLDINLTTSQVISSKHIPNARPAWTGTDTTNIYNLLNTDPKVIAALAKRGITLDDINAGRVQWCVAVDGRLDNLACAHENNLDKCEAKKDSGCEKCKSIQPKDLKTRPRLYFASPWWLDGNPNSDTSVPIANYYLMPIAGIFAWIDENAEPCGKVIKVIDNGDTALAPWGLTDINCPPNAFFDAFPGTLQPLKVCQPNPSFQINGNEITWEKWKFRYSLHPTFGLVLNLVSFNDKKNPSDPDNYRSILYQANLAEALTIYGTTDDFTRVHNFLDLGEYQSRLYITSLQKESMFRHMLRCLILSSLPKQVRYFSIAMPLQSMNKMAESWWRTLTHTT